MRGAGEPAPSIELAAGPDAPALARQFLRRTVSSWSLDSLIDDGETIVSELVTNAVLHAGSDITCVVTPAGTGIRIEVWDTGRGELVLPVAVPRDRHSLLSSADDLEALEVMLLSDATTGRGLQVVDELAADWGVETQPDGKNVWATVVPGRGVARTPTRTNSLSLDQPGAEPPPGQLVRFVAVPVRLALQSDLQLDTLIREFQVMGLPHGTTQPQELVRAACEILERYAAPRRAGQRGARDAASRGDRLVDVSLTMPVAAPPALRRLLSLVEDVDRFCSSGALLALASPPELQAFRLWYVEEVERQFAGHPAQACPFPVEPVATEAAPDEELDAPSRHELARVSDALAAVTTLRDLAHVVLTEAVGALGADRASFCLVADDAESVDIVEAVGYPDDVERHWSRFSLSADLPASEAIRTGRSIVLRTRSERDGRYPVFASTPALQDPSFVCVPFPRDTAPARGALVLNFARSRDFRPRDLRLVSEFCDVAGRALDGIAR